MGKADTPELLPGTLDLLILKTLNQQAVNQTVSGVRVRSQMVPAVTEVRPRHPEHLSRPSPSRQPPSWPQSAQAKPAGQRGVVA